MKYYHYIILVCYMLALSSCMQNKNKNFNIVTSIPPIANLIAEIGGSNVHVYSLVDCFVDPHDFTLKTSDVIKLAQADMIVVLDRHFDQELLTTADTKRTFVLNESSQNAHPVSLHSSHDHEENPHIWLSFSYSLMLADKIADLLGKSLPESKNQFLTNAESFKLEISNLFLAQKNKYFNLDHKISIVQKHGAWDFLVEELGISNIGTLEQFEGDQTSIKKMIQLIQKIENSSNHVLLIDDAYSSSSIMQRLASETETTILTFNPMQAPDQSVRIVDILRGYSDLLMQN